MNCFTSQWNNFEAIQLICKDALDGFSHATILLASPKCYTDHFAHIRKIPSCLWPHEDDAHRFCDLTKMVSTLRFAAALRFRTFPFLFSVGYTYDTLGSIVIRTAPWSRPMSTLWMATTRAALRLWVHLSSRQAFQLCLRQPRQHHSRDTKRLDRVNDSHLWVRSGCTTTTAASIYWARCAMRTPLACWARRWKPFRMPMATRTGRTSWRYFIRQHSLKDDRS